MATTHLTTSSLLPLFLPRLTRTIPTPTILHHTLPLLTTFTIPTLSEIWNGILNAVPKKKTSYAKKRSRFLAGKALKDVTALNTCSACGHLKRAHLLCPYCVAEIKNMWNGRMGEAKTKPADA